MKINLKTFIDIVSDCQRRDLTINSMAVRFEDWEQFKITKCPHLVIDPFQGMADIFCGVLVHTSDAFAEDPVRVLRIARFAARYNFTIQKVTIDLMKEIVHELNHVPTERIFAEFEKGLMEEHPHIMIDVLRLVGAFDVEVMKPFHRDRSSWKRPCRVESLRKAGHIKHLPSRFALISTGFTAEEFKSHRIPNDCAEMSAIINKFVEKLAWFHIFTKSDRLNVIMEMRAMQRSEEFIHQIFDIVDILFDRGCTIHREQFLKDLRCIKKVDAAAIASDVKATFNPDNIWDIGTTIKWAIFNARLDSMDIGEHPMFVPGQ